MKQKQKQWGLFCTYLVSSLTSISCCAAMGVLDCPAVSSGLSSPFVELTTYNSASCHYHPHIKQQPTNKVYLISEHGTITYTGCSCMALDGYKLSWKSYQTIDCICYLSLQFTFTLCPVESAPHTYQIKVWSSKICLLLYSQHQDVSVNLSQAISVRHARPVFWCTQGIYRFGSEDSLVMTHPQIQRFYQLHVLIFQ